MVDARCSLEVAARIKECLGAPALLRARGQATWRRKSDGSWDRKDFEITDFSPLEEKPLTDIFDEMRGLQGSAFSDTPDPVQAMLDYRHGDKKP